jgi:hypothetical protein
MLRRFRNWFEPNPPDPAPAQKTCDHPACLEDGAYRAPKSREQISSSHNDDWLWFCLEHVRKYNTKWNYYANMSEIEVEADIRANYTWQCPSWPLGQWSASLGTKQAPIFDPFDFITEPQAPRPAPANPLREQETQALALLNIGYPFSFEQLREAYRFLVKKHHPDTNAGCPHAEEKIKKINEAYALLKTLL